MSIGLKCANGDVACLQSVCKETDNPAKCELYAACGEKSSCGIKILCAETDKNCWNQWASVSAYGATVNAAAAGRKRLQQSIKAGRTNPIHFA
jgi:hypothetical protein